MIIGIILAAGKGKRFGAEEKNKTAEMFAGKPLVKYGVELFEKTTDKIVVVLGVAADSVKAAIGINDKVEYVFQPEPKGTGDAFKTAMAGIKETDVELVFCGYGDHMMFYQSETLEKMKEMIRQGADVVLLTTTFSEPDKLAWGRIIRDQEGFIEKIVEQKDANEEENKVAEVNPGFYAFKYEFARDYCDRLTPSPVSGEYYITDLVEQANRAGKKVAGLEVPFEQVGYGINTREELRESEQLFLGK
jgi:bifunctional UDP-N-acetylglucosamine pyrophosphorylase/glucosamine-1-phosphate N-acetyltransferase